MRNGYDFFKAKGKNSAAAKVIAFLFCIFLAASQAEVPCTLIHDYSSVISVRAINC